MHTGRTKKRTPCGTKVEEVTTTRLLLVPGTSVYCVLPRATTVVRLTYYCSKLSEEVKLKNIVRIYQIAPGTAP